jgi:hypothetical protein
MQGTRNENALLFYVVFVPEIRRKLQKSGRFCVEISVHFVPLAMAKQQERYPIDRRSSLIIVQRSSFNVHRSTFNVRQPTTSSTKNLSLSPTTNYLQVSKPLADDILLSC